MSTPKILVFDCDGVVADIVPGMSSMCEQLTGKECRPEQWVDYNHFENLGLTHEAYLRGMIEHKILENAVAFDGAIAAIRRAQKMKIQIALVTARDFHPTGKSVTATWFEQHDIKLDHLLLVGASGSKVEAIKSLPNVIGYADDYVPHLESLQNAGVEIPLYLVSRPWNASNTTFQRVNSAEEFVNRSIANM